MRGVMFVLNQPGKEASLRHRPRGSKIELQAELDNSRIVAGRDDAAKIARSEDPSCSWIDATAGCKESVQITDGICEVYVIEQVEKVSAKLKTPRLCNEGSLRSDSPVGVSIATYWLLLF